MFAVKRRLKLNNQEKAKLVAHAGFSRFVYNYGLSLFCQSINADVRVKILCVLPMSQKNLLS